MQLRDLVDQLQTLKTQGSLETTITGVCCDSRRVTPGAVFVAVPGHEANGHDFVMEAIDRGAVAVVCEQNGFVQSRASIVKVRDAREALGRAAAAFYRHPSTKLRVVGVTGTNGKTTVTFMVKAILEAAGIKTGLIGTIQHEIGDRVLPAQRTTPGAVEIQQMMASMVRNNCQACVMEISSHALDQKRICGVEFDVAIFTNLTQDHLDYHGTLEAYFQAKEKLFTGLRDSSKPGAAIINIDDSAGQRLVQSVNPEILISYGVTTPAKLRANRIELKPAMTAMEIESPVGSINCRMPLIGRHNVYNALAAIGAGIALKIETSVIQAALNGLKPISGRLERIEMGQDFGVVVDYAHTDDALQNVLTTLREITPGRVLLAFGCGGGRDPGKRAKMGRVAAELAGFTILTNDNPRKESPAKIVEQIERGFQDVPTAEYSVELDRAKAIQQLISMARRGDTVLLAGKGHESYQEFEDTIAPFSDQVHAQEALQTLGFSHSKRASQTK